MGDDKSSIPMGSRERDRELLIPVGAAGGDPADDSDHKPSSSSASSSHHSSGREVSTRSYVSLIDLLGFNYLGIRLAFCLFFLRKRLIWLPFESNFMDFKMVKFLRIRVLLNRWKPLFIHN